MGKLLLLLVLSIAISSTPVNAQARLGPAPSQLSLDFLVKSAKTMRIFKEGKEALATQDPVVIRDFGSYLTIDEHEVTRFCGHNNSVRLTS